MEIVASPATTRRVASSSLAALGAPRNDSGVWVASFMKKGWKIFLWIVSGLFVFYLGLEAGFDVRLGLEPQRELRAILKFQKAIEEIYRRDKYGGQTPEETFNLFLEALKKNDLDLASKYFVLDKQETWRQNLETIKANGHLDEMIEDLSKAEKGEVDDDEARYYMHYIDEDGGTVASPIILEKNKLSGVWKISVL